MQYWIWGGKGEEKDGMGEGTCACCVKKNKRKDKADE